jgi:hypothetical protein
MTSIDTLVHCPSWLLGGWTGFGKLRMRSQRRRQAGSGRVQRSHLAGHDCVELQPTARSQLDHSSLFGSAGFASPTSSALSVSLRAGELRDHWRTNRNGKLPEWIDGACNHNDRARPASGVFRSRSFGAEFSPGLDCDRQHSFVVKCNQLSRSGQTNTQGGQEPLKVL